MKDIPTRLTVRGESLTKRKGYRVHGKECMSSTLTLHAFGKEHLSAPTTGSPTYGQKTKVRPFCLGDPKASWEIREWRIVAL